jgi:hypothetical protein
MTHVANYALRVPAYFAASRNHGIFKPRYPSTIHGRPEHGHLSTQQTPACIFNGIQVLISFKCHRPLSRIRPRLTAEWILLRRSQTSSCRHQNRLQQTLLVVQQVTQ